ncbi:RNA polymerase sigma factor RpoD/SigA [Pendulispora albinea]|uniref:RNA polymerase sigma factor n=1 Tax=Pendulispora albinea TaxID=2741071 RepID=A0ABZ2M3Q8_9BACT
MMKSSLDPNSSVSRYIARVQRAPALSREDEWALAVRVRDLGDPEAVGALVEANLRHVVAIALTYRRYGLRLADLISEGNVGLMTALRKFDPDRGTRFVTYAAHWIRAYILDYVIRAWSIVGVGAGPLRSKVFFRLRREKAKISALTSDSDEVAEQLASRFGTTKEKISQLAQRVEARDLSLDTKAHDDTTASIVDALPSPLPSQEERFLRYERTHEIEHRVREALDELDPRERYIVTVRVMADDPDELSLAEIGRRLGVSRERARQIESRAKMKLRRRLGQELEMKGAMVAEAETPVATTGKAA